MESSRHIFQNPKYTSGNGNWSENFLDVATSSPSLTWDPAAFLSFVTHGYVCGNRTLVKEVQRLPWLSRTDVDGSVIEEVVPQHGFRALTALQFAEELLHRLEVEAETACRGFDDVYILTSGGLDSRIVAGVVRRLVDQNRISSNVHAVTWGRNGSRDVNIGKFVAGKLGFPWQQLELGEAHFEENIAASANELGALVSPVHLHRMMWFRQVASEGGLVLAGSYGDSVGRAEYSGRTTLEILPYKFSNQFNLLRDDVVADGQHHLNADMLEYRNRFDGRPEYAKRECEQQCHYMRGMIAQTMSVITDPNNCTLYQMFSAPEVFEFVWGVHPAYRTDKPYAEILKLLGRDLENIPWARTNRPLKGKKAINVNSKVNQYHDYSNWIQSILERVDLDDHVAWLESTGMFKESSILEIVKRLKESNSSGFRQSATGFISWTMSLRQLGQQLSIDAPLLQTTALKSQPEPFREVSGIRRYLREKPVVLRTVRSIRKWLKMKQSVRKYPPQS